jgi:hypothetical protein
MDPADSLFLSQVQSYSILHKLLRTHTMNNGLYTFMPRELHEVSEFKYWHYC